MKTTTVMYGFSPNIKYGVFNVTLRTALKSVYERMLYVKKDGMFVEPPKPIPGVYERRLWRIKRYFGEVKRAAALTKESFLGTYVGRKLQTYTRAFETLKVRPLNQKDSSINWFVKIEKQRFDDSKEPVPRGISPRNPRYHVNLGLYVKRIEKKIYKMLDRYAGHRVIFKGLNARDRGRCLREHWGHFKRPVAFDLDASRFDQHVDLEALLWEHSIYKSFYPSDGRFARLLRMQEKNVCVVRLPDGNFKFIVIGRRMSGDMNTGLGNCLIMTSLMITFCEEKEIEYRLADDGDDTVLIIDEDDLPKMEGVTEWFLEMGFTMKVGNPVRIFEQIEFCQSHPVWTPEGYVMVRNLTALSKDCISTTRLQSEKHCKRWMKAVGLCGLSLTGGIPVYQDFYNRMVVLAGGVKPLATQEGQETGMQRMAKNMKRQYSSVHPQTRVSFWRAFGMEPDKQLVLEEEYRTRQFAPYSSDQHHPLRDFPF